MARKSQSVKQKIVRCVRYARYHTPRCTEQSMSISWALFKRLIIAEAMTWNGVPIDLDKLETIADSRTVGLQDTRAVAVSVNEQSAKMASLKFYVITFEFPSGTTHNAQTHAHSNDTWRKLYDKQAATGDCHTRTHKHPHSHSHPTRTPFVMLIAVRGRKRDTLPQFPHDANSNVWRPRLGGKFCTSIIADGRTAGQTDRLVGWPGDC